MAATRLTAPAAPADPAGAAASAGARDRRPSTAASSSPSSRPPTSSSVGSGTGPTSGVATRAAAATRPRRARPSHTSPTTAATASSDLQDAGQPPPQRRPVRQVDGGDGLVERVGEVGAGRGSGVATRRRPIAAAGLAAAAGDLAGGQLDLRPLGLRRRRQRRAPERRELGSGGVCFEAAPIRSRRSGSGRSRAHPPGERPAGAGARAAAVVGVDRVEHRGHAGRVGERVDEQVAPAPLLGVALGLADAGAQRVGRGLDVGDDALRDHLVVLTASAIASRRSRHALTGAGRHRQHRHLRQPVVAQQPLQVGHALVHLVVRQPVDLVQHHHHDVVVLGEPLQVAGVQQVVGVLLRVDDPHQQVDQRRPAGRPRAGARPAVESWSGRSSSTRPCRSLWSVPSSSDSRVVRCRRGTSSQSSRASPPSPHTTAVGLDVVGRRAPTVATLDARPAR